MKTQAMEQQMAYLENTLKTFKESSNAKVLSLPAKMKNMSEMEIYDALIDFKQTIKDEIILKFKEAAENINHFYN